MMIRHSKNGTLYYFNLKNYSVTMKCGNVTRMIFVGEKCHESGQEFTEDDFYHMLTSLEA